MDAKNFYVLYRNRNTITKTLKVSFLEKTRFQARDIFQFDHISARQTFRVLSYFMNNLKQEFESRPLPVTFLSVFVLCMTSWHGIRVYGAIVNWEILSRFNGNPAYILMTGLIWVIVGLSLFMTFWESRRFALAAGLTTLILYVAWFWFDRLVIQASPAANLAFSAVISIVAFSIFMAGLMWPSSRAFFRRRQDERHFKN